MQRSSRQTEQTERTDTQPATAPLRPREHAHANDCRSALASK